MHNIIRGLGENASWKKPEDENPMTLSNHWESEGVEERDATTLTGCVGLTVIWSGATSYNRFFVEVSTNGLHGVPSQDVNPGVCPTAGQLTTLCLSYAATCPSYAAPYLFYAAPIWAKLHQLHPLWATLHLWKCINGKGRIQEFFYKLMQVLTACPRKISTHVLVFEKFRKGDFQRVPFNRILLKGEELRF